MVSIRDLETLGLLLVALGFRAVVGQIKDFDISQALGKPCLDRLAVMHAEVVEDQQQSVPWGSLLVMAVWLYSEAVQDGHQDS